MPLRLRALRALALAALVSTAMPAAAHAGSYSVSVDTSKDVSGWDFSHDDGFYGCSIKSHPGPCADGDVPSPTPLRIFAYGAASHLANAYWQWLAPPTTSIASGSVTVAVKTAATDTYGYMKARLRSESFVGSKQLHVTSADGTETWSIPAGNQAVGVFLKTDVDRTYNDKWNNNVRVTRLTATLTDDTAPAVDVSGRLASGAWLNESQPVCLTVQATDAGAGVADAELRDGAAAVDADAVPVQSATQPGADAYTHDLCATPAAFGDGVHALEVIVRDAAGETTTTPVDVRVDAHAPTAVTMSPAGSTTNLRPHVSFSVDPGPSGLGSFEATVDGAAMAISGADADYTPSADLAYGAHTVAYRATDGAGNVRDGFWTFNVVDADPPQLSGAVPADGSSGEERRPEIAFNLSDAGTGIDPATLRVALDGVDVTAAGAYADGHFTLTPASDLGYGQHRVRVAVSDRAGNAMAPAQWDFTVADATPPVFSDVSPRDGSSGSDRTPPISVALQDAGIGVDQASIVVTLDGADVSALATFAGGRVSYTPGAPLGFGLHTASVTAADRAGNQASAVTWSFAVADELAPAVTYRRPLPGSTATGAETIAFDVSDAGTGVDPASLQVTVDGSDVTSWGSFSAGHFSYAPGNLGAGVHTIAVTVSDNAGNVAGPVMWQFAVADPATLHVAATAGPHAIVAGQKATLRFAATSNGTAIADARVLVATRPAGQATFGPARVMTASATGIVSWTVAPTRTITYRVELADHPAVNATRTVVVHQRITLAASTYRLRRGGTVRLSGRVAPAHPGGRVELQLLTSRGWRTVAADRLNARSVFATTVIAALPGRYVLRAVTAATTTDAAGTSRTVTVRVS